MGHAIYATRLYWAGTRGGIAKLHGRCVEIHAPPHIGGASFRVATIAHNEVDDARVSLKIDHDEGGFFIATGDGEDTEARFATAEQAYASIATRWGNGWDLRLAGE